MAPNSPKGSQIVLESVWMMLIHKNCVYRCISTIKLILKITLEIWSMYGVLRATCGSNHLGVDDENDFPNALNPTQISEWNQGNYKGHQY